MRGLVALLSGGDWPPDILLMFKVSYLWYRCRSLLSDMVEMFKRCAKNLKQKSKGSNRKNTNTTTNLPAWFNHHQYSPELDSEQVKKHAKKLEFYLSWSRDYHGQLIDDFH